MKGKRNYLLVLVCILIVAILDFVTALFVNVFNVPVFLDSWATSLGVMLGSLLVGLFGGILFNIIMALTFWGIDAWVWAFVNAWIAIVTYFFLKHGWLRKWWKVIIAGLIIGFSNALITFEINALVFNSLPTYEPTKWLNATLLDISGNAEIASFFEHLSVELLDKTASLFIAFLVFKAIPLNIKRKIKRMLRPVF